MEGPNPLRQTDNAVVKTKSGIGGWLLIPAIALIFRIIQHTVQTINTLNSDAWNYSVNKLLTAYNLITLGITLLLAYIFFSKKVYASPGYIVTKLISAALIGIIYCSINLNNLIGEARSMLAGLFIIDVLGCFIIIPYLLFSKRTANTFINDLDIEKPFDFMLDYLAPFLIRVDRFFKKTRKLIFLELVLFVVLVILIGVAMGVALSYI